jgi:hypothetical protein
MKKQKIKLINELSSPLFRIMSVFNNDSPSNRKFCNNICAFHIGNGYVLSVAHNLNIQFSDANANISGKVIDLYGQGTCKPFLVVQFRNNKFYNNDEATEKINPNHIFYEQQFLRHTFIIELELVEAFYNEDFALYRIVNTDRTVINLLPSVKLSYKLLTSENDSLFCLQSSPFHEIGKMVNIAKVEGILDSWSEAGSHILDGTRYLVRGYFRFGSSGAPYLIYDKILRQFRVNGIQSQASPVQLCINGNRDNNFQYVNAIVSPLFNIKEKLKPYVK